MLGHSEQNIFFFYFVCWHSVYFDLVFFPYLCRLVKELGNHDIVQIACGDHHSMALSRGSMHSFPPNGSLLRLKESMIRSFCCCCCMHEGGNLFTWGRNTHGQLGVGSQDPLISKPQLVKGLKGIPLAQIAAGGAHSVVVSLSGAVYSWGKNNFGQLGLGHTKDRGRPAYVEALEHWKAVFISCGADHTAVLSKDGLVYTFGAGGAGQLGHNSTRNELTPRVVAELWGARVSQVACGRQHTLVYVPSLDKVYSFGSYQGQLESERKANQLIPLPINSPVDNGKFCQGNDGCRCLRSVLISSTSGKGKVFVFLISCPPLARWPRALTSEAAWRAGTPRSAAATAPAAAPARGPAPGRSPHGSPPPSVAPPPRRARSRVAWRLPGPPLRLQCAAEPCRAARRRRAVVPGRLAARLLSPWLSPGSQVCFAGEDGQGVGPRRELFTLAARVLCDPQSGVFCHFPSRLVWFPRQASSHGDTFLLVGTLCGMALYNHCQTPFPFPRALFKKMQDVEPTLEDLEELIPAVGRYGMSQMEEGGSVVELKKNGANILVTKQNRKEFVDLYVNYVLNESIRKPFEDFMRGFLRGCPAETWKVFLPVELQVVLLVHTNYDWDLLKKNVKYVRYNESDQTIKNFWTVFHKLPEEKKKKFLAFLSGSDRIIPYGLDYFVFSIQDPLCENPDNSYPSAQTCSCALFLPRYSSKEILEEKLLSAIEHSEGFGLR
uniref:HECT domain-containing protein n=1 Tax=Pavo cristatus TaxID=9049 RepID=A0A8C9F6X6_PAVCR